MEFIAYGTLTPSQVSKWNNVCETYRALQKENGVNEALDEIKEKYGFEGKAIVTMAEVTEYLYNREHNGRVVINDEIKAAIDKYYEEYGCK